MLKALATDPEAAVDASATWYECVLELGSHSPRCQTLAARIVDLRAIWTVELIISLLGILTFILETSRKYVSPTRDTDSLDSGGLAGEIFCPRNPCPS